MWNVGDIFVIVYRAKLDLREAYFLYNRNEILTYEMHKHLQYNEGKQL